MSYSRFAVYYLPPDGDVAAFGASWLGWDVAQGAPADQPDVAGLHDITMTPRKYGFHGTLKPPFRLAEGTDLEGLQTAVADLATRLTPATCDGLELSALGHFLAFTPTGDTSGLRMIAAGCVTKLDHFRAPPTAAELTRRRAAGLSARQAALLAEWGYPYVMEEFRFHLTLSGRLPAEDVAQWKTTIANHMPALPAPLIIDQIALCGERADGCFELIHRYTLTG